MQSAFINEHGSFAHAHVSTHFMLTAHSHAPPLLTPPPGCSHMHGVLVLRRVRWWKGRACSTSGGGQAVL